MTELTIQQKYRVKDIGIIIFLSIVAILLGIFIPVENYFQLVCKIVVVIILLIGSISMFRRPGDNSLSYKDWIYNHVFVDDKNNTYGYPYIGLVGKDNKLHDEMTRSRIGVVSKSRETNGKAYIFKTRSNNVFIYRKYQDITDSDKNMHIEINDKKLYKITAEEAKDMIPIEVRRVSVMDQLEIRNKEDVQKGLMRARTERAKKGELFRVDGEIEPKTSESFETPVVPFDSDN